MERYTAQPVLERRFLLGEGPVWLPREQTLVFVDIKTGSLYRYRESDESLTETQMGQYLGAAAPTTGGGFLLAMAAGLYHYHDDTGLRRLAAPEGMAANLRGNDGKCDPRGRFWFGTMPLFGGPPAVTGSLYRCDPDGSCHTMLTGVGVSNGLDWSSDGKTLYYNDTPTGRVDAFAFDMEAGALSGRRAVISLAQGQPDGMTLDAEGMLWVALWGGGRVLRVDPARGSVLAEVPLPCENVTSCCFGGADLATLYITTSGEGSERPGAGRLYRLRPGVCGRPGACFDDSALRGG